MEPDPSSEDRAHYVSSGEKMLPILLLLARTTITIDSNFYSVEELVSILPKESLSRSVSPYLAKLPIFVRFTGSVSDFEESLALTLQSSWVKEKKVLRLERTADETKRLIDAENVRLFDAVKSELASMKSSIASHESLQTRFLTFAKQMTPNAQSQMFPANGTFIESWLADKILIELGESYFLKVRPNELRMFSNVQSPAFQTLLPAMKSSLEAVEGLHKLATEFSERFPKSGPYRLYQRLASNGHSTEIDKVFVQIGRTYNSYGIGITAFNKEGDDLGWGSRSISTGNANTLPYLNKPSPIVRLSPELQKYAQLHSTRSKFGEGHFTRLCEEV